MHNKDFRGDGEEFEKLFRGVSKVRKLSMLTVHWNLTKFVMNFHGVTELQHHIDPTRTALRKETCAERKELLQFCCNLASMRNGGLISMECHCFLRRSSRFLGRWRNFSDRRFGEPFNAPIIPFGALVEYHPISARDQSRDQDWKSRSEERKQALVTEKPELDNARRLRGIYFVTQMMENTEENMIAEKIGSFDGGGNPLQKEGQGQKILIGPASGNGKARAYAPFPIPRTKYACVVEAHKATSCNFHFSKIMKTTLEAKVFFLNDPRQFGS